MREEVSTYYSRRATDSRLAMHQHVLAPYDGGGDEICRGLQQATNVCVSIVLNVELKVAEFVVKVGLAATRNSVLHAEIVKRPSVHLSRNVETWTVIIETGPHRCRRVGRWSRCLLLLPIFASARRLASGCRSGRSFCARCSQSDAARGSDPLACADFCYFYPFIVECHLCVKYDMKTMPAPFHIRHRPGRGYLESAVPTPSGQLQQKQSPS